jgi:hypothetical protein
MSFDENGLGTELRSSAKRHGGVDAELAGGIRGGGDDAALIPLAADHDRLAFECRIEEFFHRYKEGIHVYVADDALHKNSVAL